MTTTRFVIGSLAAVLMALSGVAHSLAGWRELRRALSSTNVPADVASGLAIPWHFTGMAMVLLGLLAGVTLVRVRADGGSLLVVALVGGAYVAFGAWGMLAVKPVATSLIFLVPGLMLLASAWGGG